MAANQASAPGYDPHKPEQLQTAQLRWEALTPTASDFDDVYFSRDAGPEESRFVFLDHNQLPARWQSCDYFVMGEIGFGTGLNLLVAIQDFLTQAPPQARLHWISTELYPVSPEDLQKAHQCWPALGEVAAWLQAVYPQAVSGFHRLQLHPRISLDLLLGDAESHLSHYQGRVDAWCLDGFAPSKNPGLWSDTLLQQIARLSRPGTTLATFTAAGFVRRGLEAVGFQVNKVPGFGKKREMLCAQFDSASLASTSAPPSAPPGKVAIIGAGLAGLATAEALKRRGIQVDIFEAGEIGQQGSGNRQGVLYIKLAVDSNPSNRLFLHGLNFSRLWLKRLDPEQVFWRPSGVLQLAHTAAEQARQARFFARQSLPETLVHPVSAEQATELAGTPIHTEGLFYPLAGWVRPSALAAELGKQFNVQTHQPVLQLDALDSGWQLHTPSGQHHYDQVILACASQAKDFGVTDWLPIKALGGQVTHLPVRQDQTLPRCVVCGKGYVSPAYEKNLCFGATYRLHDPDLSLKVSDHQHNLEALQSSLPQLLSQLDADLQQPPQGKVGQRCTSPDYLPLVGAAPDPKDPQQPLPGLWLNLAHGSRGLASIPLCSELLVSQLLNEPLPVDRELLKHLNPARFLLRKNKKPKA